MLDVTVSDRSWERAHPLLKSRFQLLSARMHDELGIQLWISEIYRSDDRQKYLYEQGRSRPGPVVTNASSAALSAHGYAREVTSTSGQPIMVPAACAIDVVPVGLDARPWTKDDDWTPFVAATTDPGSMGYEIGLVHFHRPGIAVSDQPHLQLREWSDKLHRLVV